MFQKSSLRFTSLYFSSIGPKQSLCIFLEILLFPLRNKSKIRESFHKNYSNFFNGNAVFSYSSARSALYSCLKTAGVKKGDEVLISSFTCLAVPTSVVALGAIPQYCDIDKLSLNVDLDSLKKNITKKTKAIVIQHTLGSAANVAKIKEFVEGRDIIIIEDCALSIGSTNGKTLLGGQGDASIFSLELSKTISSGWGGILVVNNKELAKLVSEDYKSIGEISSFKSLRMAIQTALCGIFYLPYVYPLGKYFIALFFKIRFFQPSSPSCQETGAVEDDFLSKLPMPLMSLAKAQISRFNEITSKHKTNSYIIRLKLEELNFKILGNYPDINDSVSPRVPLLVQDRGSFIDYFLKRGIEVGQWFDGPLSPIPKNNIFNYDGEDHPNASFIAKHIVNIPCHSRLNSNDLTLIETTLSQFAKDFPEQLDIKEISQNSL